MFVTYFLLKCVKILVLILIVDFFTCMSTIFLNIFSTIIKLNLNISLINKYMKINI